jgi:dTDP-4-dehydrorhamnose 3,5-epimerase
LTKVEASAVIADVMIVTPDVFGDSRGRFIETYRRTWFPLGREMVQGNRSDRQGGALVGLHYHFHQADYWYVTRGRARVVLHDLRIGSPTEGATEILEIGEHDDRGVFIPPGVGHGFAAVTDLTLTYLVDSYYNPADELGVAWDDPDLKADWGIADPVVSARDQPNPRRAEIPDHLRPRHGLRA